MERERRASRLAGRISLLAAALVAVWLILRPLPGAASGRLWAGVTVLVTYLLVRKIMAKALLETKWAGPQGT